MTDEQRCENLDCEGPWLSDYLEEVIEHHDLFNDRGWMIGRSERAIYVYLCSQCRNGDKIRVRR